MSDFDAILAKPHSETLETLLSKGIPKFVYYTNAATALNILTNSEIWMRNASLMNDYSEIAYGIERIVDSFGQNTEFSHILGHESQRLSFDLFNDFAQSFDDWIFDLKTNTYLTCISVHDDHENQFGRLSMWRAYGPKNGIALVINSEPMLRVEDRMGVYSTPVFYWSEDDAKQKFKEIIDEISPHLREMSHQNWESMKNSLSHFLRIYALSIKHPGFSEEKEWRVYFRPTEDKSNYVSSAIECINGLPQVVQKLELSEEVEVSPKQLFQRLIIGPAEHQFQLADTFAEVLRKIGIEDPWETIQVSTIPLRN